MYWYTSKMYVFSFAGWLFWPDKKHEKILPEIKGCTIRPWSCSSSLLAYGSAEEWGNLSGRWRETFETCGKTLWSGKLKWPLCFCGFLNLDNGKYRMLCNLKNVILLIIYIIYTMVYVLYIYIMVYIIYDIYIMAYDVYIK